MKCRSNFILLSLLITSGAYAFDKKRNDEPVEQARIRKKMETERKQATVLLSELYPMDLSAFKKRVPSLSEEERGIFLATIVSPEMTQYFLGESLKNQQNISAREKVLFLAPKMRRKPGQLLYWAYKNNDKSVIAQLKKAGYLPSEALVAAIGEMDEQIVKQLLKDGVKVTTQGVSRLLMGLGFVDQKRYIKAKKMLAQLLPKIENINQPTEQRRTLLSYSPNTEIAKLLLNVGVKINNKVDIDLLSRPIKGIIFAQEIIAKHQDEKLKSELAFRIKGQKDLIRLYIAYGADPMVKNKEGKSAIDLAKDAGFDDVIAILEGGKKK